MKIATFNINGIKARLPALLDWLSETMPDIAMLQEIKSVEFREPFHPRRGRINCSLNDNGKWRWLGVQFTIRPD